MRVPSRQAQDGDLNNQCVFGVLAIESGRLYAVLNAKLLNYD